jgi:hypothetical protein
MSFTHRNHYVPEWYQKRFLPDGQGKYFFLKLQPKVTKLPDGRSWTETARNQWGPPRCFYEDDLYTTRFGGALNDDIEKQLFGRIDGDGKAAIEHFADYRFDSQAERALHQLMDYMDAQVLRTPRGIARIRQMTKSSDHNLALMAMQQIRQVHQTMWLECVWEVVDCSGSGVDLLVSDNPVTFYNRAIFPGARQCAYPLEPDLSLVGTQTLFPLQKSKLLVLTHLQFARDPSYNPKVARINPRYFASTFFDLRSVITESRKLDAEAVLKVNHIIKSRAHQFVAASTKEGLFPEKQLRTTHWSKLGEDEFLLPDPREIEFSTAILVGYGDGRPGWGQDEYGRPPSRNDMEDPSRGREWRALHRRREEWDKRYGALDHAPTHLRGFGPGKRRSTSKPTRESAPPDAAKAESRSTPVTKDTGPPSDC